MRNAIGPPPVELPDRTFSIAPRSAAAFDAKVVELNGEQAYVVTGGVILTVRNVQKINVR